MNPFRPTAVRTARLLPSALLPCLLAGLLPAQTGGAPTGGSRTEAARADEPVRRDLRTALERLSAEDEIELTGRIEREVPEQAFGGTQVTVSGIGSDAEPFVGDVLGRLRPRGGTVLVSRRVLPGFGLWTDGVRTLTTTSFEDAQVGTRELTDDLTILLDLNRILRALPHAQRLRREERQDGGSVLHAELPRSLIRGSSGPLATITPRVLRVTARVELDRAGRVAGLRFEVRRSDPTADLRARALAGELAGGTATLDDFDSDAEGPLAIYSFARAAAPAGGRLARVAAELEALARE